MSEENLDDHINDDLVSILNALEKLRGSITQLQLGTLSRVSFSHLPERDEIAVGHNLKDSMEMYSTSMLSLLGHTGNLCGNLEKRGIDLSALKKYMSVKGKNNS